MENIARVKIFDSHAHYDDDAFNEDRDSVIEDLFKGNVIGILNCGSTFEGAEISVDLANRYEKIYAAVGIHPEFADIVNEDIIEKLNKMALNKKVKSIGEIGLDYYYEENPEREIQKKAFRVQMQLAEKLNLPVVIHSREASEDTLKIVKEFPNVKGVIHCFSGSVEIAKEYIKLGYYIGIGGVITFKNSKKIKEVCKELPMDKILVETDCPYMAPTPHRGKRNKSDYIEYIIGEISKVKEIDSEKISEITIENTKGLFCI